MFERKPFILHVKLSSFGEIIFIGVHLKPENVYDEFRYLRTVIDELKTTSSIILLGDFNADCSYLNNAKKNELRKTYFNAFQWLIDDHTETNLSQSCSYDRIIVSSGTSQWKKINWKLKTNGTFPFVKKFKLTKQSALQISDHYPVEVDIY
jgi:deoxyribonuclease-1-like protein